MPVYDAYRGDRGWTFCDGRLVHRCIRVDTDAGTALAYASTDDGGILLRRGKPVVRQVRGAMTYIPMGPYA